MEFTVRITAETSIESLEDTIAMCTALLKSKRQRLQGPSSGKRTKKAVAEAPSFTPPSVPVGPLAAPAQLNGQPDNRTALQAPVPFVPHAGHAPQPVPFVQLPPGFDAGESTIEGKPEWPTDTVRVPVGGALPAPVPFPPRPGAARAAPFVPVPFFNPEPAAPALAAPSTTKETNR